MSASKMRVFLYEKTQIRAHYTKNRPKLDLN